MFPQDFYALNVSGFFFLFWHTMWGNWSLKALAHSLNSLNFTPMQIPYFPRVKIENRLINLYWLYSGMLGAHWCLTSSLNYHGLSPAWVHLYVMSSDSLQRLMYLDLHIFVCVLTRLDKWEKGGPRLLNP